jgi:hypothetical protein
LNRTNNRFAFQFKPKKSGFHRLFVAILIDTDETALKDDSEEVSFAEIRSSSRVFEIDSDSEEEHLQTDEAVQNVFDTWYPKKQNVKGSPFEFSVLPGAYNIIIPHNIFTLLNDQNNAFKRSMHENFFKIILQLFLLAFINLSVF